MATTPIKQNMFHYKPYVILTYFNIIKEIRWALQDHQVI